MLLATSLFGEGAGFSVGSVVISAKTEPKLDL